MSGVIDLSELKNKKAAKKDEAPSYEELTDEQKAAVEALAAEEDESITSRPVITAFLVTLEEDGHWVAHPEVNQDLRLARTMDADDIIAAGAVLQKDVLTQESAVRTQMVMMQAARQAQAAMQQQQIQQHLAKDPNFKI